MAARLETNKRSCFGSDDAKTNGSAGGIGRKGTGSSSESYAPRDDEPFMNPRQLDYFRVKLLKWKQSILEEGRKTIHNLRCEDSNLPDAADRASSETDRSLELRTRDRQRKLIAKIDSALERIVNGVYGYCDETGEPISLKRLKARPIATLSLEAQEMRECRERMRRSS